MRAPHGCAKLLNVITRTATSAMESAADAKKDLIVLIANITKSVKTQTTTGDYRKKRSAKGDASTMNYRQWKKKYKKTHGNNPPIELDKKKQKKAAKQLVKIIARADLSELTKNVAEAMRNIGEVIAEQIKKAAETVSEMLKEIEEHIQKPICESPDCKNCPFPQCAQEYVDKCIELQKEREKKENEKEMQELREDI